MTQKLKVKSNDTLLKYLLTSELSLSNSKIKSLLKHQCIQVNGKITTQFDFPIKENDEITIEKYNQQYNSQLEIIYEDAEIVVVNKPEKLLSIATEKNNTQTAYRYVSDYLKTSNPNNRVFVLHRLDKDTSGVLMFAKSAHIQKLYQQNWNHLVVKRNYHAVCEGQIKEKGQITSKLKEDNTTRVYTSKDGKDAITDYKPISSNNEFTLLDVEIKTGRKNQIRVHLSSINHPVVGDTKYDAKTNPFNRLGLHAYKLVVTHPITKKVQTFTATTPKSFSKITKKTK